MNKFSFIIITLFSSIFLNLNVYGQGVSQSQLKFNKYCDKLNPDILSKTFELEGDYYWDENFKPGQVKLKENDSLLDLNLRYCIYNQEFQFVLNGDTVSLNRIDKVEYITINNSKFIYTESHINNKKSCYEILVDGSFQLLKHYKCKLVKGKENVSSFEEKIPDHYIIKTNLFFKKNNQDILKIPSKKSNFYKIFNTSNDKLIKFVNSNKYKHKKEPDLIKIFTYYNSL